MGLCSEFFSLGIDLLPSPFIRVRKDVSKSMFDDFSLFKTLKLSEGSESKSWDHNQGEGDET